MTIEAQSEDEDLGQSKIVRVDSAAIAAINKSDVEAQLDAAHKYPRSVKRFLEEAKGMVTLTRQIAKACIYALPRGGKVIPGPSVRLAEISASAYGNLQIAARVVAAEEREVVAQGVCWDMEKNVRMAVESRRSIIDRNGRRYNDDMITMTGNAGASIALRNSIFRIIPRAYIDKLYSEARAVSVGDASTLAQRRTDAVQDLVKTGVSPERIFARIGRAGLVEVTLEDLEILIGLQTALENGETDIDKLFPAVEGMGSSSSARSVEDALRRPAPTNGHAAPPATPDPVTEPPKRRQRAQAAPAQQQIPEKPTGEGTVGTSPTTPADPGEGKRPETASGHQGDTSASPGTARPEAPGAGVGPLPGQPPAQTASPPAKPMSPLEQEFARMDAWKYAVGIAVKWTRNGNVTLTTTAGKPRVFLNTAVIEVNDGSGGNEVAQLSELEPYVKP